MQRADKLADKIRVLAALNTPDPNTTVARSGQLCLPSCFKKRCTAWRKIASTRRSLNMRKTCSSDPRVWTWADLKRHDPDRWHHFDTVSHRPEAALGGR